MCYQCGNCAKQHEFSVDDAIDTVLDFAKSKNQRLLDV
jgi:hypothetical protein